ncbi:hypothetical protein FSP39_018618 [Pinctada imbricata]|uniref:Uncharacterized protein n=1 Tax=Pinctada imbricata TaxID=66713 RepID=A0AA88YEC6_PINIB|nr:hypothetical protein FSP39_018618 [Pinctada imbricata]
MATASVLQGQPPPPGTDLELLLKAPPPPPPPDDKEQKGIENITDGKRYTESPYTTYGAPSHNGAQPGYGTTGLPPVHGTQDGSYYGSEPVEEPCTSSSAYEPSDNPVDTQDQPMEEDAAVIARPPQVIAREPMVFSEPMPSHSNEGVMPSSEQFEYQGEETYAKASGDANSSSYSEKKKKKKDKSMSSSNLTLKKKHVSSLVQKWQKVKKEVEIEERNREEREMAIRQKLEEWKQQDY